MSNSLHNITVVYNTDNQRAKMDVTQSGTNILTRWYAGGSYMKETAGSVTKEYTYIGGDAYTAPVAAVTQSGTTTYYYLLRDYLGNITHQVNTSNVVVAEYNFDAWGRRRSADDWSYTLDGNDLTLFADRGFTGHEHLPWFNLINMNGRLYDPLVGRFLNVDPFVQDGGLTQSYNRYSYCLNNPLRYTDSSGYLFKEILGFFGAVLSPFDFLGRIIFGGESLKTAWRESGNNIKDFWDVGKNIDDKLFGGPSVSIGRDKLYSSPYVPQDGDVLIQNFQNNQTSQIPGQCFAFGMEYISIYYNGKARSGDYMKWYMKSYNDVNFITNGITKIDRAEATLSNFFTINKISIDNIAQTINNGYPIMANIYTGTQYLDRDLRKKTLVYHNVVIIGYNSSDGTYIIMDPATGTYARIDQSSLNSGTSNDYLFEVIGIK